MASILTNYDIFDLLKTTLTEDQEVQLTLDLVKAAIRNAIDTKHSDGTISDSQLDQIEQLLDNGLNGVQLQTSIIEIVPDMEAHVVEQMNLLKRDALISQIGDFTAYVNSQNKTLQPQEQENISVLKDILTNNTPDGLEEKLDQYNQIKKNYNFD